MRKKDRPVVSLYALKNPEGCIYHWSVFAKKSRVQELVRRWDYVWSEAEAVGFKVVEIKLTEITK